MEALRFSRSTVEVQVLSVPASQSASPESEELQIDSNHAEAEAETVQPAEALKPDEIELCLSVLQKLADHPSLIDQLPRFKTLIAKIHRKGQRELRVRKRQERQAEDRTRSEQSGIVRQQLGTATALQNLMPLISPEPEPVRFLIEPRTCYTCKQPFTELHHFYHLLCPDCGRQNWSKRHQRAELSGRCAIVTGGRIKIGFQTVLRLLRDGARVLVTTRFPFDAAQRYFAEPDFEIWKERLEIQGLDLRDLPQVEAFASQQLERGSPIDILIHNAAQTVKRPLAFYRHLLETIPLPHPALSVLRDAETSNVLLESRPNYRGHLPGPEDYFPLSQLDRDGQQVDFRPLNSWLLKLGEVSTVEMVETWLVNAAAPFVLTSRLKPLLLRSPFARRFVVNVSAMEGQFARQNKTVNHPHTNMAKAALNMLTRTSAADLARDCIYMNSVDTGWITDENPHPVAQRVRTEDGFYTPLDIIDGAARIYDPIATGVNDSAEPLFGHFLKDYRPFAW